MSNCDGGVKGWPALQMPGRVLRCSFALDVSTPYVQGWRMSGRLYMRAPVKAGLKKIMPDGLATTAYQRLSTGWLCLQAREKLFALKVFTAGRS
eukprot:1157697-Pelagomonas_calceolata.AAC.13